MSKKVISQIEWDRIFKACYNSDRFEFATDIEDWMNKKFIIGGSE